MTYEIHKNWRQLSSSQSRQNSCFMSGKRRLHITLSHRIYEFVHAFPERPNETIVSPFPSTPFPIHLSLITCSLWTSEHVIKNYISYASYIASGMTKIMNIILGEKWIWMASLNVNLILRLLAEGAENKAGNVLITKYCGITYYECVCVCVCLSYFSGMQGACAV